MTDNKISRKRISLRVTNDLYSELSEKARQLGVSINAYITMILSKELCKEN